MALNKAGLEAELQQILSNPQTESNVNAVAAAIANAVDTYVKSAEIIYTTGLSAPNGPVTGTFEGRIQ